MRFEVNETAKGIVAPSKDICKIRGCNNLRMKRNRPHAFCKKHSGFRCQMSKKKFKELVNNNEWAVPDIATNKENQDAKV